MKVGVIGAGAWGTALAITAYRANNTVRLWAREENVVAQINADHQNIFLPDVILPPEIVATTDLQSLIEWADVVLLVSAGTIHPFHVGNNQTVLATGNPTGSLRQRH